MNIEKNVQIPAFFHPREKEAETITTVTFRCRDGFTLSLCSLGASIKQISVPTNEGGLQNIALSFADDCAYRSNPLYAGATLAPCAGRISGGRLPIKESICALSRNENECHTLHGGFHNASFFNWHLLSLSGGDAPCQPPTGTPLAQPPAESGFRDCAQAIFSCTLPDGLDGFPGNRTLKVIYTLTEQHQLTVKYEAQSDRDTYFNLSNHSYFNLSGDFSRPAYGHVLQIFADHYICNAPDFIPEGSMAVQNTPFDFRRPRSLHSQMSAFPGDIQLARNQGYNHGFILNPEIFRSCGPQSGDWEISDKTNLLCTLPDSPVKLAVSSDAPCMVLYSGGYIPRALSLSGGQKSCPGCALAFEFQDYPDAPGGHGFPYHVTPAETLWERTICYHVLY